MVAVSRRAKERIKKMLPLTGKQIKSLCFYVKFFWLIFVENEQFFLKKFVRKLK
jgi:hypothetical protein